MNNPDDPTPLPLELGEPHDTVRRNVIQLRRDAKLSRRALSRELGLATDSIRDLEGGRKGCTLDLACKLSEHFGVSLDFLVGLEVVTWQQARRRIAGLALHPQFAEPST